MKEGGKNTAFHMTHRPEIIFTDIMIPHKDGFYGIEKIREFDPEAKIVAVTVDISSETEQKLNELNITAIIYKPFTYHEIKQVLMQEYKINTVTFAFFQIISFQQS